MTTFEVIGTIEPDNDHGAVHEALEELNAELGGSFRALSHYESGQEAISQYYIVEEIEE